MRLGYTQKNNWPNSKTRSFNEAEAHAPRIRPRIFRKLFWFTASFNEAEAHAPRIRYFRK